MESASRHAGILVVDDDSANRLALEEALRSLGARLVVATSGEDALRRVLDDDFAAILMDVRMPGIDGFTTAAMIRERRRSRNTPIIFMTAALADMGAMFRGYRAGAVDYLVKPLIPEVLRSKLAVFIGMHDMHRMLSAELEERSATERRLRASEENLRALAEHLQTVREEERIHIAREIHDELGQALTVLKFDINALARALVAAGGDEGGRAAGVGKAIDRIIHSVRRIASGLRPEVLDEIGLAAAIEWQAREFSRRTGVRCHVEIEAGFADPDHKRATAVFRIFQELLTNVARHADATRVDVRLADGGAIRLEVCDNGRGIERARAENPRSLGLLGLRERVQAFSGQIEIIGEPGRGTTVRVAIPSRQLEGVIPA